MSFQFVEHGKIDGSARKAIRSHVMKGHIVGKIRTPSARKEKPLPYSNKKIAPKQALQFLPSQSKFIETFKLPFPRSPGSLFSSFSFPSEMRSYGLMEKLIYNSKYAVFIPFKNKSDTNLVMVIAETSVYPTEFCLPIEGQKSLWFQYLLSDEACMLPGSLT
jgi:hypothetical protein